MYKDAIYFYTDGKVKVGDIRLAENKLDEKMLDVNSDDEFADIHIYHITKDEFERKWNEVKKIVRQQGILERNYLN